MNHAGMKAIEFRTNPHGVVTKKFSLFRLWRDVTEALKTNDIESATAAKHKVFVEKIIP